MKECELCNLPARMHCESDQANLCWDCDAKVHSANFLVARHSRNLLCQVCQSPTPWKACGAKLGPTVSVCERCVNRGNERQERDEEGEGEGGDEEDEGDDEDEDEDDDDDDDDGDGGGDGYVDGDGDEEDGDNQVVPWTSTPTPPVASSSSSEESSSRICNGGGGSSETAVALSLKRMRENADLGSQGDLDCSSAQSNYKFSTAAARTFEDEATSFGPSRPLKDRKKTGTLRLDRADVAADTRSALVVSLKRLQQNYLFDANNDASATILDICKLTKDPAAVDFISTGSQSPPI